jgi:hypothetical protein
MHWLRGDHASRRVAVTALSLSLLALDAGPHSPMTLWAAGLFIEDGCAGATF